MPQDYASSIQGAAIRVTRLAADGTLAVGPSASYVMNAFISVSFTPEFEEGEDITQKGADGSICVAFKTNDMLKRVTLELAVCDPDPQFAEILCGGTLLSNAGDTVGYAAPSVGGDSNPNGSMLEVWSKAIVSGRAAGTNPYWQWIFPYVQLRQTGDRVIENGLLANTFSGWGTGLASIADGTAQHTNAAWPFVTDRPYAYARSATAPPEPRGYVAVTGP